jgi:hypothetical protein
MFIYDPTCFSLTAIFRDHSNTAGRLQDHYITYYKIKYNYNNKTTEENYKIVNKNDNVYINQLR